MDLRFPLIRTINESSEGKLISILEKEGFNIINLNGSNILDEKSFFKEIVNQRIPLNPPLSGKVHYDAFHDSMWGGLSDLGYKKVALIWTDFNKMLESGLNDFLSIAGSFYFIAEQVTHLEYGINQAVDLKIFLIGKGENFSNVL
jgi:hypothetical protein